MGVTRRSVFLAGCAWLAAARGAPAAPHAPSHGKDAPPAEAPAVPAPSASPQASAGHEDIQTWIVELAASREEARLRAAWRLKKAGPAAIPSLEKVAASESALGFRAREVLDFLKGPGADWGAWLRAAGACVNDPAAFAEAAKPFAKLGGRPVAFLHEAVRREEDPALKRAALALLEKHCAFTVTLAAEWTASREGTGCVVTGTTDLPAGTVLSCWAYAVFPPGKDGESRERYVWGESAEVKDGAFTVTFAPEPIAPGGYRIQAEVALPRPGERAGSLLLLDADTENERWVGGVSGIGSTVLVTLGEPDEIARERVTGPARVRQALERLSAAYGRLATRVVWSDGKAPEDEVAAAAAQLASNRDLHDVSVRLDAKNPLERARGRRELDAMDPLLERPVWVCAAATKSQTARDLAGRLLADWESRVAWTRDETAFPRLFPGRDDEVMRTLAPYERSARAAHRLGQRLLVLGNSLLGPVAGAEGQAGEHHEHGRDGKEKEAPPSLDGWIAEYHEAIRTWAQDRIENNLSLVEKILREAEEREAACRALTADRAKAAWEKDAAAWERDLARLSEEWAREAVEHPDMKPFEKKAAAFLRERVSDFPGVLAACREAVAARGESLADPARRADAQGKTARLRESLQASRSSVQQGVVTIGMCRANPKTREVEFDAVVNMRQGLAELLLSSPEGKLHEAMLVVKGRPSDLYYALLRVGFSPGQAPNMAGAENRPAGDLVDVWVEWREKDGGWRQMRAEELLVNMTTGKPLARRGWVFVGSEFFAETDPSTGTPLTYFMANAFGSVATASAGYITSTVLDSTLRLGYGEVVADAGALPVEGTAVRVRVKPVPPAEAAAIAGQMKADLEEMRKREAEAEQEGGKTNE